MCRPLQPPGLHITRVYVERSECGKSAWSVPKELLTAYVAHSTFSDLEPQIRSILNANGVPAPDMLLFWAGRRMVHEYRYPELFPTADALRLRAKAPACLTCSLFGPYHV